MYQVYGKYTDGPWGWFKMGKPFKTKKEAQAFIKRKQRFKVNALMIQHKIEKVK